MEARTPQILDLNSLESMSETRFAANLEQIDTVLVHANPLLSIDFAIITDLQHTELDISLRFFSSQSRTAKREQSDSSCVISFEARTAREILWYSKKDTEPRKLKISWRVSFGPALMFGIWSERISVS